MYCAICKKWMDSDALICPECEALLRQRQTPPAPQPPQPTPAEMPISQPAPVEVPNPQPYYQPPTPVPTAIPPRDLTPPAPTSILSPHPDPLNRMFGFGKALTATILGFVGFIAAYVGIMLLAELAVYYPYDTTPGVVAFLIALPCFIISLILGIQSIRCFKVRRFSCAKNIPTLILGIVGVATSGLTALYLLLLGMMLALV